jgi:squalene-hopene/tetraprenyl-beta-curcumene cyclase
MMQRSGALLALPLAGLLAALGPTGQAAGPDKKEWDKVVGKAAAYYRATQAADGSWGGKQATGVTGLALTGMLRCGALDKRDPAAEKALKYIESLIDPKDKHIAGKGARIGLHNYVTAINVMALVAADSQAYKPVVGDAVKYLKQLQWDEGQGKNPKDDFYGGAGYDSKSRPDLSNTQFFLDALVAAGVPKDDPAYKKAAVFISRCQNLTGENQDQPWAAKTNDGSFIYSAAGGGQTKVKDETGPDVALPGYGSMTYAGIKSLIYCGVSPQDDRVKKAYAWVKANYTLKKNPGMPEGREEWGLFYYYHTMAKCLDTLGVDEVEDAAGKKHDWRAELTAELAKRQRDDGSWVNDKDKWMEGDPQVVTAYALLTLSYCKPK